VSTTTFTNRTGGTSTGAFASLNLGTHVGDDPSSVEKNRAIVSSLYGPVQYMNQVHGDRIAIIEEVTDEAPTADALVTGIPGITLAVLVADCIPLLLRSDEVVAAVHVGRKGFINGVTAKVIELMRDMGAQKILATIGPHICGSCYEVSKEMCDQVSASFPEVRSETPDHKPALDLLAGLVKVLKSNEIEIEDQSRCTVESHDLFSYRRDGVTGRHVGLISL
jgi:YfiH family protein